MRFVPFTFFFILYFSNIPITKYSKQRRIVTVTKIDSLSYGTFTFCDRVILPVDTPESFGLKSEDIIIFQFYPDVKKRLDAEREEIEILKRKEQIKQLVEQRLERRVVRRNALL